MKIIKHIWNDIQSGSNIDVYITLAIAIVLATLGIVGLANQQIISSAILATLALISISLLVTRHDNQRTQNVLERLENANGLSERFLKKGFDRSILPKHLRMARKVFFWGFTFTSTIPYLRDEFEKGLQSGLEMKFLLVEPYSSAISMIMFLREKEKVDEFNQSIKTNLAQLSRHAKKASSGKIEVRLLNYVPPYTMIVLDPHLPTGRMFIRLADFSVPREHSPWFELSQTDDKSWFKFFLDQFELVWQNAKKYSLIEED